MPVDISNALQAGDKAQAKTAIFQEVGPRGGKTKNYIILPRGAILPDPKKIGNQWVTTAEFGETKKKGKRKKRH